MHYASLILAVLGGAFVGRGFFCRFNMGYEGGEWISAGTIINRMLIGSVLFLVALVVAPWPYQLWAGLAAPLAGGVWFFLSCMYEGAGGPGA